MSDSESYVLLLQVFDRDRKQAEEKLHALLRSLARWAETRGQEGDEVSQEVFFRALERISLGKPIPSDNPFPYIWGIARHVVSQRRRRRIPDSLDESGPLLSAWNARSIELETYIGECLDRLSAEERDLILLYYRNGPKDTQQLLGITPNALRIRLFRIRRNLEHQLRIQKPKKQETKSRAKAISKRGSN